MGSGLSMASVNKIKELANSREYSLALDIIESQDLSKSLNPQFLRLCGEIYMKTGHYREARKVLIMAHRLAPEAKRIIYSFVELYLRVGYSSLANTYYEMYLFDADEDSMETKQIKYIYAKANNASLDELESIIAPIYTHTMDYDWSFELFLVFMLQTKADDAVALATEFTAMFKNSDNCRNIEDIANGRKKISEFFDVYADEPVPDDDEADEEMRMEEMKLLEADELRMHPKEAEITIIFDDREEENAFSRRRLKKLLKEQEKEQIEHDTETALDESSSSDAADSVENKKNGFLKKVLSKVKKSVKEESGQAELELENAETATSEEMIPEIIQQGEAVMQEAEKTVDESLEDSQITANVEEMSFENPEDEIAEDDTDVAENIENKDVESIKEITEISDADEGSEMREIHLKQHKSKINPIVSVDLDDDFTAESNTIDELKDGTDYGNPFESISAIKKEKEESRFVPKPKMEIVFEDAQISPEESDSEFEVDDFSVEPDSEFEDAASDFKEFEVKTETEYEKEHSEELETVEELLETEIKTESKCEEENSGTQEVVEELLESEVETEPEYEEENSCVQETVEEPLESEVETEPEYEEENLGVQEAVEEPLESEVEAEPEYEEENSGVQETVAEALKAEVEADSEYEEEDSEEPEIVAASSETEVEDEPEQTIEQFEEPHMIENSENESEFQYHSDFETRKKKLDFPVFRSSLFPEYNQKIEEVENNFNEIMNEAQDKIQENKRKEEQMLREAEELLASMGIHLDDVNVTSNSMESIGETLYNEPSRDELKASLKIDSVKKDILDKLKDCR